MCGEGEHIACKCRSDGERVEGGKWEAALWDREGGREQHLQTVCGRY